MRIGFCSDFENNKRKAWREEQIRRSVTNRFVQVCCERNTNGLGVDLTFNIGNSKKPVHRAVVRGILSKTYTPLLKCQDFVM